ncbi:thioredoxin [uncultured Clostridium sp.]|uniref:thioredoxin n=1 Tax=uncultured Clostridium sp. TaxID=59620 RepID=UPI0028E24A2A|nr:thioredoxin [uncultured Clostridium sp.]
MAREVKDSVFKQEVLNSDKTVVVDFWAAWCGPCRMLAPVIDELSEELKGKAEFVKVNVDENPVTSNQFKVASIPTLLVFKEGKVVETLVGFRPKQALKMAIEKHV